MQESLNEMVELLREIRDGIEKTNDHLDDIKAKMNNIDGLYNLDDLHSAIQTLETNVSDGLSLIEIKIGS